MLKIIKGDLIALARAGQFDLIIHGANCWNIMGSGVAAQIEKAFPGAAAVDRETRRGNYSKLSDYSVWCENTESKNLFIVNLYTQYKPGPNFLPSALDLGLYKLRSQFIGISEMKIGMPWIGCGIGGYTKDEVKPILKKYAVTLDITVVDYEK